MSKLGYTWYPKDWGNSEAVFEMTLKERGLYRELIDLAMLNDNKTEVKTDVWCRKFAITQSELKTILDRLIELCVIQIESNLLFIPSCESRLNLARGGAKGGKAGKPTPKPKLKPIESLEEKNVKPTPKQIESKLNIKENENENKEKNNIPAFSEFLAYAKEKEKTVNLSALKNKYDAWVENDWKDGNNSKITNWKMKLLNTMPYLKKDESKPKFSG